VHRFHLQARCLVGPLSAPTRDETRRATSDDWNTVRAEADRLVADGFTVWLFRYGPNTRPALHPHGLHLVETLRPEPGPPSRTSASPVSGKPLSGRIPS